MKPGCPDTYRPLCEALGFDRGIPWSEHWTAAADFLELVAKEVVAHKPRRILECGSGLTTLVMARCCQRLGKGRVVSLENGGEFAHAAQNWLETYGLSSCAEVIHAPLVDIHVGEGTWQWYDCQDLPQGPFDLLVVDGPPGFLQPLSRYPALPLLADRLAKNALVILDDAARPDERAVVARWLAEYPGLGHRYLEMERGCSLLTFDE